MVWMCLVLAVRRLLSSGLGGVVLGMASQLSVCRVSFVGISYPPVHRRWQSVDPLV
jgi:hypothetical protein